MSVCVYVCKCVVHECMCVCVCVAHTRFDACNNARLLYVSMCVCDVSPQERLIILSMLKFRICEHALTVTLALLCRCMHCVNGTVFLWQLSVHMEFPFDWFSVDPPLIAHMYMCM